MIQNVSCVIYVAVDVVEVSSTLSLSLHFRGADLLHG